MIGRVITYSTLVYSVVCNPSVISADSSLSSDIWVTIWKFEIYSAAKEHHKLENGLPVIKKCLHKTFEIEISKRI